MSSSATSTAPVRPHRDVARLALPRLAWGIAIAVVVNLIVFGIASFAGASMLAGDRGVSWILVVITTVGAMVTGAIATGLLARRRGGAIRVMAWVGLVFGLVTAPSPIVVAGSIFLLGDVLKTVDRP